MQKILQILSMFYLFLSFNIDLYAVKIKDITIINNEKYFAKIKLDTSGDDRGELSNENLEIFDHNGAFTAVLLFRVLQSSTHNYRGADLLREKFKEWPLLRPLFLDSLEFFTKHISNNKAYFQLHCDLNSFLDNIRGFDVDPVTINFIPLGEIYEEFFSGKKVAFYYENNISYQIFAMEKYGITELSYDFGNIDDSQKIVFLDSFYESVKNFNKYKNNIEYTLKIKAHYKKDNKAIFSEFSQDIPKKNKDIFVTDSHMYKTFAVMKLALAMKKAIEESKENPAQATEHLETEMSSIKKAMKHFSHELDQLRGQKSWEDLLKLAKQLASNISAEHKQPARLRSRSKTFTLCSGNSERSSSCSKEGRKTGRAKIFTVSSGGAQSAAKAWDTIENGEVPKREEFNIGALLKEFDLSLTAPQCEKGQICFSSGVAYDRKSGKLFVQTAMNVIPTPEQLVRKPLNVSVLIDISGSMATRNHTSRMDWAKEALINLFTEQFKAGDYVSVYKFDDQIESVLETTLLDEECIAQVLASRFADLQPRGITNLEKALVTGFTSVLNNSMIENQRDSYEHFVILISDAQANSGETRAPELQTMVCKFAKNKIGLIAFGIGSHSGRDTGFNQSLIDAITQSRGGSYDFVSSQKAMKKMFNKLPYLVHPFAYDLTAHIDLSGFRLLRVYGTEADENSIPLKSDVISVPTLVLTPSQDGGGAIVWEYEKVSDE